MVAVLRSHLQFTYSKVALIMRFIVGPEGEQHESPRSWVIAAEKRLGLPDGFLDENGLYEVVCMDCKRTSFWGLSNFCDHCESVNVVGVGANPCATNKAIIEAREFIGYLRASLPPMGAGHQGDDWPLQLKAESMEEAARAATMISNLEIALKDVSWPNFTPSTP